MKKHAKNAKDKTDKDNYKKNLQFKDNQNILKNANQRLAYPIYEEIEDYTFDSLQERENLIFSKPKEIFPEWPNEEELINFNNQILNESSGLFYDKDNEKIRFPISLESSFQNKINWLRPYEFIRNYLIQRQIKNIFPGKQVFKMKQELKDYYYSVELLLRNIACENSRRRIINSTPTTNNQDEIKSNTIIPTQDHMATNNNGINVDINNKNQQFQISNDYNASNIKRLYFENKEDPNAFINSENLNEYKNYDFDNVTPDILNGFNDFNTNAFFNELNSNVNVNNQNSQNRHLLNNKNLSNSKNIIINESIESFNVKRNIYKSFFKFFELQQTYRVVTLTERNETDEEYKKRFLEDSKLESLLENNKNKNNKKNLFTNSNVNVQKSYLNPNISNIKINSNNKDFKVLESVENDYSENNSNINNNLNKVKELKPGNLYFSLEQKVSVFTKWLISIFQLILDLNINDVYTDKNFLFNIYPQKDNFPVVSPSGRYWIKLYYMGKPRKIEIDDRIPCDSFEDFVFPRCENIDEIWPALFTKAILKLFSYKYIHSIYNEIGDISYFYALLGYHTEVIEMTNSGKIKYLDYYFLQENEKLIESFRLKLNNINEDLNKSYLSKIHSFACLNLHNEELKMKFPPNNPLKLNFNFDFKVLDNEKDYNSITMAKILMKSKGPTINPKEEIFSKPTKPKLQSVMSRILGNKKTVNARPSIKSIENLLLLKKNVLSENSTSNPHNNNIPDNDKESKIESLNLINDNAQAMKKQENIESSVMLSNINFNLNKEDTFSEKNDEVGSNIANILLECKGQKNEKYNDFVSKLKNSLGNLRKSEKVKSTKNLSLIDFTNSKPSFKIEDKNQKTQNNPNQKQIKTSLVLKKYDDLLVNNESKTNYREDIIINFIYSVCDFFNNKKFNMERLRPLDFSDLKKLVNDAQPPGMYKRLSGEEKKKYLSNLLETKNKLIEIKNQRIEDVKKEGKQMFLIKIKNKCIGIPKFDFYIPYNDYEIYIVKKCLLNSWFLPPPSYYLERFSKSTGEEEKNDELNASKKFFKIFFPISLNNKNLLDLLSKNIHLYLKKEWLEEDKYFSHHKQENKKISKDVEEKESENNHNETNLYPPNPNLKIDISNTGKSLHHKKKKINSETMHTLLNDYTDYSTQALEPIMNSKGSGVWLNYPEFKKYFNSCVFFFNPKMFKNILNLDNNWNYNYDCYEFNYNFSIIYLHLDDADIPNHFFKNNLSSLFIVFEPNDSNCENTLEIDYYADFDLVDSSTGKIIREKIHLTNFYSNIFIEEMDCRKSYFLILKSFMTPFGFNLTLFSDHNMEYMNYDTYIKNFANFVSQKFNMDYLLIEKNKNYLLGKFSIKSCEQVKFKINIGIDDSLAKNYIEIYLIYGKNSSKIKKITFNSLTLFSIEPLANNEPYYLVIVINPPFNIKEGSFILEFFYDKQNVEIQLIEYMEPYKIFEKFMPNKYGVLFKETITCLETVYATMDISLKKVLEKDECHNYENDRYMDERVTSNLGENKYNNNNHKNEGNINLHNNFFKEKEYLKTEINNKLNLECIKEKIRMKLLITKNNQIYYEDDFYNQTLIKNFIFDNPYSNILALGNEEHNKHKQKNSIVGNIPNKEIYTYQMVCYFDMSELEKIKQGLDNIIWEIKIFSSENLLFSKDTSKEDREKYIKESWEINEPGRSDLGKLSRFRFLLINKKQNGEKLSTSEDNFLKQERIKKLALSAENFFNFDKINNLSKKKFNLLEPINNKKPSPIFTNSLTTRNNINNIESNLILNFNNDEHSKYNKIELKPIIVKPDNHRSYYIKNFINYSLKERTVIKGENLPESQRILITDENRKKKIEAIDKNFYVFENYKKTENEEAEKNIINIPDNIKLFYKTTNSWRQQSREGNFSLYRQRDYLRGKFDRINSYEKNINDVLNSNITDINYITTIYEECLSIEGLNDKLKRRLFDFISIKKNEFYNNELKRLTIKDKNLIIKYIENLKTSKFNMDVEIIQKLEALIIEPTKSAKKDDKKKDKK